VELISENGKVVNDTTKKTNRIW